MSGYPTSGYYDIKGRVLNKDVNPQDGIPDWIVLPQTKNTYHTGQGWNLDDFVSDVESAANQAGISLIHDSTRQIAIIYAGNMYADGTLHPNANADGYIVVSERYKPGTGSEQTEYADAPFTHIGLACHEFGHKIGYHDLYYDDDGGIDEKDIRSWGLMGSGNWNGSVNKPGSWPAPVNPYYRHETGWLNYHLVSSYSANTTIDYSSNYSSTDVYSIHASNNYGTPSNYEYFLVEKREDEGWNSYLYEHGIIIWRINSYENEVDLIEHDGEPEDVANNDVFLSGDYITDYGSSDYPAQSNTLKFNSTVSNVSVTNITGYPAGTMQANLSPYWAGEIPESMVWDKSGVHVGENLKIPDGMQLTIEESVWFGSNSYLTVEGNLTFDDKTIVSLNPRPGVSWHGIRVSLGQMILSTNIHISNASIGISIFNDNGFSNESDYLVEIDDCSSYGIWIDASSPHLNNIHIDDCGDADIIITDGDSDPTIEYTTLVNPSDVGVKMSNGVDATFNHCDIENINSHRIYLDGTGIGLDMSYNNLDFNSYNGQLAIDNGSNWVDARVNYFGNDGIYNSGDEECPLSVIFSDTTKVENWWYRSTTHINNGAPSKMAIPSMENPFNYAHEIEFSGDFDKALDLYFGIINTSDNPYYRRKAIKSILRINENRRLPYDKVREIIINEIALIDRSINLKCFFLGISLHSNIS